MLSEQSFFNTYRTIHGLGIKSGQLFFFTRLIDLEKTWKYTNILQMEVDSVRCSWMYE